MYNIQMKNKVLLLILDGFGINKSKKGNAILNAKTPNLEKLYKTSISTTLKAAGIYVGLPPHIMGNSEVGHSTIGAGRRVKQYLELINDDIKSNILLLQIDGLYGCVHLHQTVIPLYEYFFYVYLRIIFLFLLFHF